MPIGTIKFFNAGKGFGFVTPDAGDADIFLPATAVTASGLSSVKQGQRVTFEQAPDTKGPKVIALKLLGDPPVKTHRPAPDRLTVYCDPSGDIAADILNEIRAAGYELQLHDYVSTPLSLEPLRRLSQMLSEAGQSLVRRYDPLFLALRLDDRFITDQDFWTGIAEHPALINGPVLQQSGKARICRTAADVRAFLNNTVEAVHNPKTLSPRIAAMLKGETVPAAPSPANGNEPAGKNLANRKLPPQEKSAPQIVKNAVAKLAKKPKQNAVVTPRAAMPGKGKAVAKKAVRLVKKPKKPSRG